MVVVCSVYLASHRHWSLLGHTGHCSMDSAITGEDVQEILFYLDPLIRSAGPGPASQAYTLVRALQEAEGGWGQYRLAAKLRLRLREAMMEAIRAEVRTVVL